MTQKSTQPIEPATATVDDVQAIFQRARAGTPRPDDSHTLAAIRQERPRSFAGIAAAFVARALGGQHGGK